MTYKPRVLVLALVLALAATLSAQVARQTGVIRGLITDNENNPIPGMTVTTKGPALIGAVSALSTGDGSFRLSGLPPGTYQVSAELSGFKTVVQEGIIVQTGQVVTINLKTEPSAINEVITVPAAAPTARVLPDPEGPNSTRDVA